MKSMLESKGQQFIEVKRYSQWYRKVMELQKKYMEMVIHMEITKEKDKKMGQILIQTFQTPISAIDSIGDKQIT